MGKRRIDDPDESIETIDDSSGAEEFEPHRPGRGHLRRAAEKQQNKQLWSLKYSPHDLSELCIHYKKLEEVRSAIEQMVEHNGWDDRILVLSGPSGAGKSTAARLVCESLLSGSRSGSRNALFESVEKEDNGEDGSEVIQFTNRTTSTSKESSPVTYFAEFLDQCKLLTAGHEKCIIVEELPNVYHDETLLSFRKALFDWLEIERNVRLPPLIICVTEYDSDDKGLFTLDSTFKVETVFGRNLLALERRGWRRIKFNAVAKSFLKKALKRVVAGEGETFRRIPKGVVNAKLDELAQFGDLRNAINTLEYWAKFLYPKDAGLGKETGLNIFHSIGKIVYGTQHPNQELANFLKSGTRMAEEPTLADINTVTASNVADDLASTAQKLGLNILENYLTVNPPITEELALLTDNLSLADTMSTGLAKCGTQNTKTLSMVTFYSCLSSRILCSKLKQPGSGAMHRLKYSRDSKVRQRLRKLQQELRTHKEIRANNLVDEGHYCHLPDTDALLIDSMASKLGGGFQNIVLADSEFQPEEKQADEMLPPPSATAYYDDFEDDPIEEDSEDEFSDDDLVLQL